MQPRDTGGAPDAARRSGARWPDDATRRGGAGRRPWLQGTEAYGGILWLASYGGILWGIN